MKADPKLFIISGPSGAGKGTLVAELLKRVPSISRVVTVTTRAARRGEVNGVDYYFVAEEDFERQRRRGDFLEWALVHGNYYATPREEVEKKLSLEQDVVLVIDVQGAASVKDQMPQAYLIFIQPPSTAELMARLTRRETESEAEVKRRLSAAEIEMELAKKYDYVIINDQVERAAGELIDVVNRVKNNSQGNHAL